MSLPLALGGVKDQDVRVALERLAGSFPVGTVPDASVTSAKIVNGTIVAADIASATITDAKLASPNNAVYRTLLQIGGRITTAAATATNYLLIASANDAVPANAATSASAGQNFGRWLDGADYAVAGLTAKLRVRLIVTTVSAAPAVTISTTLNPITVTTNTQTIGTAVTGSTLTCATPAASSVTQQVTSDFAFPSAALYAPVLTFSGAANPSGNFSVLYELQWRSV